MGLRGPGAKPVGQKAGKPPGRRARKHSWERPGLILAERVIRFIESTSFYRRGSSGAVVLTPEQRQIIRSLCGSG